MHACTVLHSSVYFTTYNDYFKGVQEKCRPRTSFESFEQPKDNILTVDTCEPGSPSTSFGSEPEVTNLEKVRPETAKKRK